MNKKLVYRLSCEEGLGIRRRKPRRRKSVQVRETRVPVQHANQIWSMDFMSDQLVWVAVGGSTVHAATVTWFGPSQSANSNATWTGTTSVQNNGVAFVSGTASDCSMDWLKLGLNTSSMTALGLGRNGRIQGRIGDGTGNDEAR